MKKIIILLLVVLVIIYLKKRNENFESVPPVLCGERIWCTGCDDKITEKKCTDRMGNFSKCGNGNRCQDYLRTLEYGVCKDTIFE